MKDYYQLLNISRGASPEQIKHAYREYAKHFHPDRHQNSAFFTERFREIQEAYEALSDPQRRSRYDALTAEKESNSVQIPAEQAREMANLRRLVEEQQVRLHAYREVEPWYRAWQKIRPLAPWALRLLKLLIRFR